MYGFLWTDSSRERNALTKQYEPIQPFLLYAISEHFDCTHFFDVGSNVGLYAILLSISESVEKVYAFEPDENAFDELSKNIYLNSKGRKIVPSKVAVSSSDGDLLFGVHSPCSGINGIVDTSIHDVNKYKEIMQVSAIALDSVFEIRDSVIALKVDVEGHEYNVLKGARNLLSTNKVVLQIEDRGKSNNRSEEILKDLGFSRFFSVSEDAYYSNFLNSSDKELIVQLFQKASSLVVENNLKRWPFKGTIADSFEMEAKVSGTGLDASCNLNSSWFGDEAEFAFYLIRDGRKVDQKWYAPNTQVSFPLDFDWSEVSVQAFLRDSGVKEKSLSKIITFKKGENGVIESGEKKVVFENKDPATLLRKELEEVNARYRQATASIEELKLDIEEEQNKTSELEVARESLESELYRRTESLDRANASIEKLKLDLEERRSKVTELEAARDSLESELYRRSERLNQANEKYRKVTGETVPKLSRELKRAREEKAAAQRALSATRSSLTYKAGLFVRAASTSFTDAAKLPVRLWRLHRQAARHKAPISPAEQTQDKLEDSKPEPINRLSPKAGLAKAPDGASLQTSSIENKPNNKIRMACVMDDFTFGSYQPECELKQLTPNGWKQEIEAFQPELLFIESAWRGKDELWGSKVGHCSEELQGIVAWCRERHIPTVFWNKEDPVHFETFLTTAQLFDFVFTTDMDCIHRYKAALGHEHVYFLPFACQPAVHNPIEKYQRKDAFCFAGAYYARYPERTRDLESFVQELPAFRPLDIYDRNYGKEDPNYQFPEAYQPHIVGTLPFSEIDKAYKGYRYAINLNSIKQSQTMFARRVYELLGSNTLTISNYSRGVRLMFGDLVVTSDSGSEVRRRLEQLEAGAVVDRLRLAGLRKVMKEHTYADRLNYILEKVTNMSRNQSLPAFTVIAPVGTEKAAQALIDNAHRQQGVNVQLVLVCEESLDSSMAEQLLQSAGLRGQVLRLESLTGETVLEVAGDESWVCAMHPEDYYGPNFLLDIALASRYSNAKVIGKAAYFAADDDAGVLHCNPEQSYQKSASLAIRRAAIHPQTAGAIRVREWLGQLDERSYEEADQLAIDSFNYCKDAGSLPPNAVVESIDDLKLNPGIGLDELTRMAEAVEPMEGDLDHAPWLDGAQFAHVLLGEPFSWLNGGGLAGSKDEERSIKLSRNVLISARLMGPLLELDSQLPDGKHEYLYAASDQPWPSLRDQLAVSADGSLPVHMQVDPGLNLSLVVLYLDGKKQRLDHDILQVNRNTWITPAKDTEYLRFGLRVYAGGNCKVHRLILGHLDLEPANILGQSDVLLLTNHYPSYGDLYRNGFVHSRVKAYREHDVRVDVFRLRKDQPISWHEFQDIDVTTGSQQALRRMLASGRYRHVLVHFLNPDMWGVLREFIDSIRVTVWVHGADIQPWYRRKFNLETPQQEEAAKEASEKRMNFWRSVLSPIPKNLRLVFVSRYFADEVMEDLAFRLPDDRFSVIHNPVDTDLFSYIEKTPEQRKKILSIRPYSSKVYANDLTVKCIQQLACEPFFNELEFRVIGDGILFEDTVKPLKEYKNVVVEKKFLVQSDIAALHKEYGVFLCPTRYDTQGVSRDEAMSSGLVPITNDAGAVSEFVDDMCGFIVPSESAEGLASAIVSIFNEPNMYLEKSERSFKKVKFSRSNDIVIAQELGVFCDFD